MNEKKRNKIKGLQRFEFREDNPSLSAPFNNSLKYKGIATQLMPTIHKPDTQQKPKRASPLDTYTIPIIVPSDYAKQPYDKQTSDWYILFRYRIRPGEKMRPVFKRVDLNYYRGRDKVKRAEYLQKLFHTALKNGLNPFEDELNYGDQVNAFDHLKYKHLPEALQEIFNLEKNAWQKKTLSTYLSSKRVFCRFLFEKKWEKVTVEAFNKSMAKSYSDWLLSMNYDLTTHNNHLRMAGTFFGYFYEREVIDVNPFSRIKLKRDGEGGHVPFTEKEANKIKAWCKKYYPAAYIFTLFVEDTMMRSGELRRLLISDIDFKNLTVKVLSNHRAGRVNKDKATRYIELSKPVASLLRKHMAGKQENMLIFGKGFSPGPPHGKRTDISKEYTCILRKLGFGAEYTLYSWRHTGTQKKFVSGMSPYKLMNQLGHEDWDTTRNYLKRLGIYELSN